MGRIELIENFIDYLYEETLKQVYREMRRDGERPIDILGSGQWLYCRESLTQPDDYLYTNIVKRVIEDFMGGIWFDEEYTIKNGAQQVCFIFDNEVYKVSCNRVGDAVNNFIANVDEKYQELFVGYEYCKYYKNCYIYRQHKIRSCDWTMQYRHSARSLNFEDIETWTIDDDFLRDAIAVEYGVDYLTGFCADLVDLSECADYDLDLNPWNWGVNEDNNIRIFDPIFSEYF